MALGRLFLIGGRTRLQTSREITSLTMIMEYDVIKDDWSHVTDIRVPRHDMGVAVIGIRMADKCLAAMFLRLNIHCRFLPLLMLLSKLLIAFTPAQS